MGFYTIAWQDGALSLIDQTRLPAEEIYNSYTEHRGVAQAIVDMVVRGAPAIGVTAAFGLALAAREFCQKPADEFPAAMQGAFELFRSTRPTAVNLFWAVERMKAKTLALAHLPPPEAATELEKEALKIFEEDVAACRALGRFGAELLPATATVLTHCNAGALATAGYGTALGVIRAAVEAGKKINVYADETRPFLQGARLTAWELMADGIDVTLVCDNMAGHLMKTRRIDAVVVGADRIAANGDTANKIGTYPLSIVAKAHGVPFYIAAPLSTIDLSLSSGDQIPIEERKPEEVTHAGGVRVAPAGCKVWNPSFDVSPAANIAAIITERGVARPPYEASLKALFAGA